MDVFSRMAALIAVLAMLGGFAGVRATAAPQDPPGALTFGGLQRTYYLHVPAALDRPSGLVINLHGAGQTGREQAAVTNFDAIADQHGFAVAYPDGIDLSCADGRGASVPDRQGVDDVGFLAALIDRLTQEYGISPERVFVTGMSAGAFMATRLACDRADLVAAIAPVAGTLGSGVVCNPSRPVSVLQVHGTADPVVPFDGGPMVGRGGPSTVVAAPAMADLWRGLNRCPGAPIDEVNPGVARRTSAGCADGTEVALVAIEGGGHIWPSGSPAVAMAGPAGQGFDAASTTGQFFAAHSG